MLDKREFAILKKGKNKGTGNLKATKATHVLLQHPATPSAAFQKTDTYAVAAFSEMATTI